jgi:hypothetical protein
MARYKNVSLDANAGGGGNGYQVKASGGQIIGFTFANTNAAWRYVKLWNQTSITLGTTPPDVTVGVAPGGTDGGASADRTRHV